MARKIALTERQAAFLDALFGPAKGDMDKAKDMAGYSKTTPVMTVVEPLKEEILERTKLIMAMNAPKAALSMAGVIDKPADMGTKEKLRACEQILDRVGVVKVEKVEVSGEGAGALFILPSKAVLAKPANDDEA